MVILTCQWCNKQFEVSDYRKNIAKYCSQECYLNYKARKTTLRKCLYCGAKFENQNNMDKKYCSPECYWKHKTQQYNICKFCGKQFKHKNKTKKYCSPECRKEHSLFNKTKVCKFCSNEFIMSSPKQEFCTKSCYWNYRNNNPHVIFQSNQWKNLVEKKCEKCGNIFKVYPYRENTAKFCSYECLHKDGYNVSNFEKDVISVLSFLLDKCNIKIGKCLNFKDRKYCPDIIINENIIIECNGDYWHCNPDLYESEFFHKNIRATAKDIWERDNIKKEYLQNKGFVVYFLWENNWNKNKESEIKNIKDIIDNEIYKN